MSDALFTIKVLNAMNDSNQSLYYLNCVLLTESGASRPLLAPLFYNRNVSSNSGNNLTTFILTASTSF